MSQLASAPQGFRVRIVALMALSACLHGCKSDFHPYTMAGSSMMPILHEGDRFFMDQTEAARTELHDGDIIAFHRDNDVIVVKRVMAMPGESISGKDRKIFRNGKPLDEPYLAPPSNEPAAMVSFPERVVPAGEYFVLGDNRDRSLDSREDQFAPVQLSDVIGKYSWTYWHAK